MPYEYIILDKIDDVAVIHLNNPEKRNAINVDMRAEYMDALENVRIDKSVGALILTGKGKAFCSGADVERLDKGRTKGDDPKEVGEVAYQRVRALVGLGKPVIAAINGAAVGAGFTIASWCDVRIAAKSAKFGALFVRRGIMADGGLIYSLTRLLGHSMACQVIFTGDFVDAEEALKIGLVSAVVPDEDLLEESLKLARRMARNAPLALRDNKEAIYRSLESDLRSQLGFEAERQMALFKTYDASEGMKAFFEKREPQFEGR
ncbi:enoyl-CoA hydratase/isomerase family protein [Chloroflexota bacterium]